MKIAHVFAAVGDNTVKLTVIDGQNRTNTLSKVITISAPTTATTTVSALILVKGTDGAPLSGVAVSPASAASTPTDTSGKVTVLTNAGGPTSLKFSKTGYADQFLNLSVPAGAGSDGYLEVTMSARDPALTLADVAAGGTLTGRDGATITLPPNAFIDAAGATVSGAVQISITPVDVTQAGAGGFPGGFEGVKTDGTKTSIVSAGVDEFVPTAQGAPVQLAPGKSASITIPIDAGTKLDASLIAVGDTIPLWSLDEATGVWIQEGSGTVIASSDSPTGLAMSAVVTHLSWWNSDIGFDPYAPKPRCEAQGGVGIPGSTDSFAAASICNMLAEIDRDLGGAGSDSARNARATVHANSQSRAQKSPAAATATPPVVAFSRQYVVPIAGGTAIPVPADTNIRLTASALNGTWTGSTVVHGAVGVEEDVVVTLHPVSQVGTGPEAITLPFDDSRSVAAAATAQFTFNTPGPAVARITITPGTGSAFSGQLRLLQGATVLGSAAIDSAARQVTAYLPAAGTYTIAADIDRAAAFRLQADLEPSDAQAQPLTLPFNGDRSLLPQATATYSFSGSVNQYVRVVVSHPVSISTGTPLTGQLRLLQGTTVLASVTLSGASTQLLTSLPANGNYTVEISGTAGTSFNLAADLEGTVQTDTLSIPTDVTRSIAAESVYQGTLTLASSTTVWLDSRRVSGDTTDVKLLAPDGTVLFDTPQVVTETDSSNSFAVTLPAGTYTVQVAPRNARAASERLTLSTTPWATVAPPLPTTSQFQTSDLVLDRNGKPVIGVFSSTVVNQLVLYTLQLRRWTGTAWESVGSDLPPGVICGENGGVSFTFDSANNPVVLSGQTVLPDGSSFFSVRRFSGGAWAPLGANDGKLPYGSAGSSICDHPTTILMGADDEPVVSYSTDHGAAVLHFDGTSWVGYATPGGDLFGDFDTYSEVQFDPAGTLWLVAGGDSFGATGGTAQRFNPSTHVWQAVGGAFPQVGTLGLVQPRLRFDSSGSPVVAWLADVGTGSVFSPGVAVYRFDGTNWTTTGGYEADSNSYGRTVPDPSFVMLNDQALVAWSSVQRDQGFLTTVVQTNTATSWTPLSGSLGQIPQYSHSGVSTTEAYNPHLATDGKDVYLAVTTLITDGTTGQNTPAVTLLKKGAN
jgi:hypothetical protein